MNQGLRPAPGPRSTMPHIKARAVRDLAAVWGLALVLLAPSAAAAGRQTPVPAPSNAACLACHKASALEGSVHASMSCRDCHAILPGEGKDVPHAKTLPLVDCNANCHREPNVKQPGLSPAAYADSVHGQGVKRGEQDVARCWDCHGKHNIKPVEDPDSVVSRKNIPLVCSRCHENMNVIVKYNIHAESPYQEYLKSVHGRAVLEKGLSKFAAVCTDCHGVHNIQGVGEVHKQARDPETCGKCHPVIFAEYKDSIHGVQALKGNIDVPLCVDCHGEHTVASPREAAAPTSKKNIPDTCSGCHARPEIMKKYGVPEDRIRTFIESFHGIAIGLGDKAEANCTDCHGVHNIRPAIDPQSTVHASNLPKTCGQPSCHPGMPAKIVQARIHRPTGIKSSGTTYLITKILLIALAAVLGLTLIRFVFELGQKKRRRAGKS
jgi:hypothetical protein